MTRFTEHHNLKLPPDWRAAASLLTAGLDDLQLVLPADAVQQLLYYGAEMLRWNKAYNLTAVSSVDEVIKRHLLDSLSILPWLRPGLTLDVGTGAGLPGIPLALALPEQPFVLLDSNGKRMRFLAHIQRQLQLTRVELVTARVEQWQPPELVVQVVTRAFAPLDRQLQWCAAVLEGGARLLAMTGKNHAEQLRNWDAEYTLRGAHKLAVPGASGERHLLEIVRA